MEAIRFSEVRTQGEFDELKLFAATFNHVIDDHTMTPIIRMYRGDRLFGYYIVVLAPIVIPAFHTDRSICSPRDFKEACEQVRAWQCQNRQSERFPFGQCWVALDDEPMIGKRIIEKLGFKDTGSNLYQYTG
jgi:hypothetical protein